jgi:hypothetical protein
VLAKQALWHLSYTSSPLCSGYFGIGSCELAAPAGLESQSSQSQSPNWQGLPAWATGTQLEKTNFNDNDQTEYKLKWTRKQHGQYNWIIFTYGTTSSKRCEEF